MWFVGVAAQRAKARDDDRGALPAFEHDLEHLLGNRARDGAIGDQAEQLARLGGSHRCIFDALAEPVQRAE